MFLYFSSNRNLETVNEQPIKVNQFVSWTKSLPPCVSVWQLLDFEGSADYLGGVYPYSIELVDQVLHTTSKNSAHYNKSNIPPYIYTIVLKNAVNEYNGRKCYQAFRPGMLGSLVLNIMKEFRARITLFTLLKKLTHDCGVFNQVPVLMTNRQVDVRTVYFGIT